MRASIAGLAALTLFAACSAEQPTERGLEISVAPLDLPGIGDACFDLRVTNGPNTTGDLVWSRGTPGLNGGTPDTGAICSDRFGDGAGDITWVGPCDASGQLDADPQGERINSVTLWFDGLYDNEGSYLDPNGPNGWQDPCQNGCTLDVLCEENADTRVAFDFTVMRQANQGFFDVAVAFDDIFCSAKLDTCYEDGSQMKLLFGAGDTRDWTAVFGFACTAGSGDTQTTLHYGDLAVVCTSGPTTTVFPLNPVGETGNNDVTTGDHTLHYGVYRGSESLACDDPSTVPIESCNKVYWNLAVSLDDLATLGTCTLAFAATATDGGQGFANGRPEGAGVSYPYIEVAATLSPATCQRHALNEGNVVKTAYRGSLASAPVVMCTSFDGSDAGPVAGADCSDSCPNDPEKTRPGLCGCGVADVDTDLDLVVDCLDGCPSDPLKASAGTCGCGVLDTDSDGDTTPDCVDLCDEDPGKSEPGICDCGVADTDTDLDGTPDCFDDCPEDDGKIEAGLCGCGTADTNSDSDSLVDCLDECPNDSNKTVPGLCGCGNADTDTDGDLTPDCDDLCPEDSLKTEGGICGCGVADTNTDGDGLVDCQDGCPSDPLKVAAGICGCGIADTNTDGDGLVDCQDGCPSDPLKVAAGICGCGTADTNTDGDSLVDCLDECPNDANKTTAGICGCGTADTNTDGDSLVDCQDGCPNDANKTSAGICGCGTADTNTDGDSLVDCQDGCPSDPLKVAAGVCGCGTADTDSDGDLTPNCNDLCPNDADKVAPGTCGCGVPEAAADRLGGTQANAASSCVEIIGAGEHCGNGAYWIDLTGGSTTDAFEAYCDMTAGGWMKVESATWPFWFGDTTWQNHNPTVPLSDNYSILDKRASFIDVSGCTTFRLRVGNSGAWLSTIAHETVWKQCHDPFTQTTDGSDYTFISGEAPTTCNGFNGLHHKYQDHSYTSDPDSADSVNCWWMQIVPKAQYGTAASYPGYLEGYGGSGNTHKWQSLWIKAQGLGLGREAPASSCAQLGTLGRPNGTYWLDPDGGDHADAFRAYCDITGGGWARIIGTSTTAADLAALPVTSNTVNNFLNDATYGVSWGTTTTVAGWGEEPYHLAIDLPYSELKVTHSGFYNSPTGGLGVLYIRNQLTTLLISSDSNTDAGAGQSLVVGGTSIYTGSTTNISNRTDTIAAAGSTSLKIAMNAYTSAYTYTRRYIRELWFR